MVGFFPLQLLADLIIPFFFFLNKENGVFLPQLCLPHSPEHYCAMAGLFNTMTILSQVLVLSSLSTIMKSKFLREEFYTKEKLVGRGSGQTERAYKLVKSKSDAK